MPWADIPDDEDGPPQGDTPTDTSSEDEDDRRCESLRFMTPPLTQEVNELRQSIT